MEWALAVRVRTGPASARGGVRRLEGCRRRGAASSAPSCDSEGVAEEDAGLTPEDMRRRGPRGDGTRPGGGEVWRKRRVGDDSTVEGLSGRTSLSADPASCPKCTMTPSRRGMSARGKADGD